MHFFYLDESGDTGNNAPFAQSAIRAATTAFGRGCVETLSPVVRHVAPLT